MEKKKKKQFVRPTVRLLEDVDALPLLTASVEGDDSSTTNSVGFNFNSVTDSSVHSLNGTTTNYGLF